METVELAHREIGVEQDGTPLILLHGLLGSSRNWQSAGKRLAESHRVYALDLRNHGDSPHHPQMDYPSLAEDVRHWMSQQGIERAHILGHSMGGKVAMFLGCRDPDYFKSLTVVDIAPRAYPPRWEREFAIMRRMPVHLFKRRQEAEAWLEKDIRDWAFRKFLVTNLERDPGGGFRWIINLQILEGALKHLFQQVPADGQCFRGPVLFMRGGKSRFVEDSDQKMITRFFAKARLETIEEAGHNVHFDCPEAFTQLFLSFLEQAER